MVVFVTPVCDNVRFIGITLLRHYLGYYAVLREGKKYSFLAKSLPSLRVKIRCKQTTLSIATQLERPRPPL